MGYYIQTHLPKVWIGLGRDPYRMDGWSFWGIILPYPEQLEGELVRALLNFEIYWNRRHGLGWRFYSPSRAELFV